MAANLTLEKVFKAKQFPKFFKINFQVEEFITTTKLKITDNATETYFLELVDIKGYCMKYFDVGKFVRVINPGVRKEDYTILIQKKSIVCIGDTISGLKQALPFQTIASTFVLNGNEEVPGRILAKVVRIYDPFGPIASRSGPRLRYSCAIRDRDGSRQTIHFWRSSSSSCPVELDKVYIFKNLKTQNFLEKPFKLVCDRDNYIEVPDTEFEKALKEVKYHDGLFKGKVLAVNNVMTFKSCNMCRCGIKGTNIFVGSQCRRCKKEIKEIIDDFSFAMIIQCGNDLKTVIVFKKMLNYEGSSTNEESIEKALINELEGKTVEGEYLDQTGDHENSEVKANTFDIVK